MAKALSRAMQEAGIRRSQRSKRVGDYRLDELLFEGPNYQDWTARHAAIDREHARVRIYAIPPAASDEEREALQRAARREYQVLLDVRHEGILKAKAYTDHVHGPALVFEHREGCQRFDHWLAERAAGLDVDTRLHLLRQIAEAVHFAHAKHLVHRALSPQSILVVDPEAPQPRVQVFNWQTGARHALDAGTPGPTTTGASRLDALVEESAWVYMAPEAITERGATGEQLDVFSLGAIAYHLFSGRPPAASLVEMTERLLQEQGLQRLDALWAQHEPGTNPRDRTSRVLDQVAGVDLNPFAVAIARFRLCVAALRAAGVHRLADSPAFEIRVATGDSLLHGPRAGTAGARQEYLDPEHDPLGHVYRTEDASAHRAPASDPRSPPLPRRGRQPALHHPLGHVYRTEDASALRATSAAATTPWSATRPTSRRRTRR